MFGSTEERNVSALVSHSGCFPLPSASQRGKGKKLKHRCGSREVLLRFDESIPMVSGWWARVAARREAAQRPHSNQDNPHSHPADSVCDRCGLCNQILEITTIFAC